MSPSVLTPPARRPVAWRTPVDATVRARVLLVDDDDAIRHALARILRTRGFDVTPVDSGVAALALLEERRFHLMLCDVRMPGLSGTELVPQALAHDPDLAILMLSGVNDAPTAARAFTQGAADYLIKPVDLPVLHQAVERALRRRELGIEQRRVERMIRDEVVLRTEELEAEKAALDGLTVRIAETLVNAMEAKDVYLRGHSQRVAELAAAMASVMGLDDGTVEQVRLAGRLHDVGKIGIRESVLNKPGRLTPEEYAHVQDHVRIGIDILAPLSHIGVALRFVEDHHEHWDGSGYPHRRAGEEISIGGRVLCAADAFDAITSKRAYRDARPVADTLRYLGSHAGTLLDPRAFAALEQVVRDRRSVALAFMDDVHG